MLAANAKSDVTLMLRERQNKINFANANLLWFNSQNPIWVSDERPKGVAVSWLSDCLFEVDCLFSVHCGRWNSTEDPSGIGISQY